MNHPIFGMLIVKFFIFGKEQIMCKILSGVVIAVLILFGSDTKAAVYKISPSGDTWV